MGAGVGATWGLGGTGLWTGRGGGTAAISGLGGTIGDGVRCEDRGRSGCGLDRGLVAAAVAARSWAPVASLPAGAGEGAACAVASAARAMRTGCGDAWNCRSRRRRRRRLRRPRRPGRTPWRRSAVSSPVGRRARPPQAEERGDQARMQQQRGRDAHRDEPTARPAGCRPLYLFAHVPGCGADLLCRGRFGETLAAAARQRVKARRRSHVPKLAANISMLFSNRRSSTVSTRPPRSGSAPSNASTPYAHAGRRIRRPRCAPMRHRGRAHQRAARRGRRRARIRSAAGPGGRVHGEPRARARLCGRPSAAGGSMCSPAASRPGRRPRPSSSPICAAPPIAPRARRRDASDRAAQRCTTIPAIFCARRRRRRRSSTASRATM